MNAEFENTKNQNALVAGMIAMVKATDLVLKSQLQDDKELITNAIALTT